MNAQNPDITIAAIETLMQSPEAADVYVMQMVLSAARRSAEARKAQETTRRRRSMGTSEE